MQIKYFSKVFPAIRQFNREKWRKYKCYQCNIFYKIKHMRTHTNRNLSEKETFILWVLIIHKTKQHKDMCQQCEFEANFPGNLDRHINMQHKMMRII